MAKPKPLEIYHRIWCQANNKTEFWLSLKLAEGFHIHHIDGCHENNAPNNLVLIWGDDHLMLHRMPRYAARKRKGDFNA